MKRTLNVVKIVLIYNIICINHGALGCNSNYTNEEQEALQKFYPIVKDILSQEYMQTDCFLIRFLHVTRLDVPKAVERIQKTMEWRKENNIEGVIDEENPVEKDLPYTAGLDIQGRPTILVRASETDLRKAIISGKGNLARRNCWKIYESLAFKAWERNVTQIVVIVDLSGFSYRRHACRECIGYMQEMTSIFEAHYPELCGRLFLINTGRLFEVILTLLKSLLEDSTKNILSVFGFDKNEWSRALSKEISMKQLKILFGKESLPVLHQAENTPRLTVKETPQKTHKFHQSSVLKGVAHAGSKSRYVFETSAAAATLAALIIFNS